MSRSILLPFAGALGGALLGAGAMAWWLSPAVTPAAVPAAAPGSVPQLEQRLQAVEAGLSSLEARVRASSIRSGSGEPQRQLPSEAARAAPTETPHPIDTPVFEAAVIDIIERAKDDRDRERAAAKDEKRRQKARHWADEVTLRLTLTPAQTEGLLEIHDDLEDELQRERERGSQPDAPFVSKEQRSETRRASRERAEQRLRALLTPSQLEAYAALDDRLKLYRPKDVD